MADTLTSKGECAYCGKEITLRDVRDRRPQYCSRACSSASRFMKRYVGQRSGRYDGPTYDKRKEL
jgi:hypothetical protein